MKQIESHEAKLDQGDGILNPLDLVRLAADKGFFCSVSLSGTGSPADASIVELWTEKKKVDDVTFSLRFEAFYWSDLIRHAVKFLEGYPGEVFTTHKAAQRRADGDLCPVCMRGKLRKFTNRAWDHDGLSCSNQECPYEVFEVDYE